MRAAIATLAIARNDVAAARLYLLDDRQHIGRKAICICLVGGCHFAFTGGDENMNPGISCGVAGVARELRPKTGPKVLAGQIRRGAGEEITAVLWASDLRGFTERSDRLAGTQVIAMLNVLFDAQAKAIAGHGGEILKFIGDGLLAIFPIEHSSVADVAARNALAAAMQAVEAARGLTSDPSLVGEPPLEIVVALHIGTAIYGNIGAADRLDFTVIGPAVNLVSRIEAVAKTLNLPIVVSADFARAYGQPLHPLGRHELRGLATPHDLFAPILPSVRI
jgi:adenylate cyclase